MQKSFSKQKEDMVGDKQMYINLPVHLEEVKNFFMIGLTVFVLIRCCRGEKLGQDVALALACPVIFYFIMYVISLVSNMWGK